MSTAKFFNFNFHVFLAKICRQDRVCCDDAKLPLFDKKNNNTRTNKKRRLPHNNDSAEKSRSKSINKTRKRHTLRSTTVSGKSNSPTMQRGMAPPHGLALSSFRSNKTVSIPFSCAKISAAQAPAGPPPTTATLYFMDKAVDEVAAV